MASRQSSETARPAAILPDPAERLGVLLPLPLAEPYAYLAPQPAPPPGSFVRVPLGRRQVIGCVWEGDWGAALDPARLRPITAVLDVPALAEGQRAFIDWVARYTLAPPGEVLALAMRAPGLFEPPRDRIGYVAAAAADAPARWTPARRRVAELAEAMPGLPAAELARLAGCTAGVVAAMADAGLLQAVTVTTPPPGQITSVPAAALTLSSDQAAAAAALRAAVTAAAPCVTLLDGVTGSGKTEVYFEAVAAALEAGQQCLILLPEIALSTGFIDRFVDRFGVAPAIWHSAVRGPVRRATWLGVADGRVRVVVGARSALFLPFAALGLIVVDEEHDQAYKQEDGVTYHARDMAVVRASLEACPVVLASATPSLETVANVAAGRYQALRLADRAAGARMPEIGLIDLRRDRPPRDGFLAPTLRQALAETLAAGDQALLFLNRRGYAPLTLCRSCGHRFQCPDCTAWLVEHRFRGRLVCHHCGHGEPVPPACPACGASDSLVACGPGVERIDEEAAALFPNARRLILASDAFQDGEALRAALAAIRDRAIDLIIGTQLAAKGHHFPGLTLVGVVDADLGLAGGDLRAAERCFQLLQQVAGRAGRAERPGRVLLQTHLPDHPVMQALAAGDRDRFVAHEQAARQVMAMPPFGRLVAVILSGRDASEVEAYARALARLAPRFDDLRVLGPAPAALSVIRGRHRWRFLVKAGRAVAAQRVVADWLRRLRPPASIRVAVDVDPYSFL